MKISVAILYLLIALHGFAKAEVVYYELPGVQGYYSWYGPTIHREDTLTYFGPTATVRAVTVNLWGETTSGLMECCYDDLNFCETVPWEGQAISCAVKKPSEPGDWNRDLTVIDSGDFELVVDLSSSNGFTVLNDGDALIVNMYIQPIGIPSGDCFDMWPPETTIDQAQLLLDISDVTPLETTSWGRIKALYRTDKR